MAPISRSSSSSCLSSHPLYIMYSSGTTGLPKCMVQSAGGILLHQLKELMLHTDLKRDDTIFYFTTCGWMMWNWLISSLAVGATLVLFDGNPFHPGPGTLWQMAQDEKITVFGTSAGYIAALQNSGLKPGERFDLAALRGPALHRFTPGRGRIRLRLHSHQARPAAGLHFRRFGSQRLLCPGQPHAARSIRANCSAGGWA